MKYLLILALFLLVGCGKKENQTNDVIVLPPSESVIEEKPSKVETIIEENKEEVIHNYTVNYKVIAEDYYAENYVKDVIIEALGGLTINKATSPYVVQEFDLDGYNYTLSFEIDGKKLNNRTIIYEDYNPYQAIVVEYKGNDYYAYFIKDDLLFARVDERNRVTNRLALTYSYNNPLVIKGTDIKISNKDDLKPYFEGNEFVDGNEVYFNDTLDIILNVTKQKEVKQDVKDVSNDTLRNLASSTIENVLNNNGFKKFVEFDGSSLVDFYFTDFNYIPVVEIDRIVNMDLPANWYRGGNFHIKCQTFVNDRRTSNLEEALTSVAKDSLKEVGSVTVDLDIKFDVVREDRGSTVNGVYHTYVTIYRNN